MRLDVIAEIVQPQKVVPAVVEFVDIAGLVKGASEGQGLGNQFLANIRETDAIAHVVRCFEDPNVVHVAGKVDPVSDIETINTELALADLDTVEKQISKYAKVAQTTGEKDAVRLVAALKKVQVALGRPRQGGAHGTEAALPAHHEADNVRRQRGGERLRRAAEAGAGLRRQGKSPGGADLGGDRIADR